MFCSVFIQRIDDANFSPPNPTAVFVVGLAVSVFSLHNLEENINNWRFVFLCDYAVIMRI